MLKQQKGISLVKLVISIIVLIALAGVAVYVFLGEDGIISKVKYDANEYKITNVEN